MKTLIKKGSFLILISLIGLIFSSQPAQSISKQELRIVKTIYQQRVNLKLCYEEGDAKFNNFNEFKKSITLYPLKERQYLIQVLCHPTAYQGVYEYYLFDSHNLSSVVFDTIDSSLEAENKLIKTRPLVGIPEYNPESQSLIIWSKGRGLGDCGFWSKYTWQESQFTLVEYREKFDCDGVFTEPNNYPLFYPIPTNSN
jgi:hypothetical protein